MYFQKTRELLVQQATDLFYKHGYTQTPIRKITENLQVENTIIYYYFKNKDELLFCIIESMLDQAISSLKDIIRCYSDPLERVQQMIFFQINLLADRKKEVKIFVEDTNKLSMEMQKNIRYRERYIYDLYAEQFSLLIKEKTIKNIEVSIIILSLFGTINWIYRWFREDGALPLEVVAMRTIEITFSGLMPERSGEKNV